MKLATGSRWRFPGGKGVKKKEGEILESRTLLVGRALWTLRALKGGEKVEVQV